MPVVLKSENSTVYPTVDVETLVNEVRERLCLKSREKLCSQPRKAPYYIGRHSSTFQLYNKKKHFSSPELCVFLCKNRHSCLCSKNTSSKLRVDEVFENPRDLLEKLISEQSLIQEAVRRLQSQTTTPAAKKKYLSFLEEDSYGQLSN